jgi:hypothetical protein
MERLRLGANVAVADLNLKSFEEICGRSPPGQSFAPVRASIFMAITPAPPDFLLFLLIFRENNSG